MRAIERLYQYFESQKIKPTRFEKDFGFSNGYFGTQRKRNANLGEDVLVKIIDNSRQLNPIWLLTGQGDMLKSEKTLAVPSSAQKGYPLVEQCAVGGFGNADFAIKEEDVKDYYVVPKFKNNKIDFMIEVRGSSMYPKYNSGDVIACTIIKDSRFLQWNKCHVIATREQGILVKRLKKSDEKECITAISDNSKYDPFNIPTAEITGIALVVGVIRLE